MYKILCDKKPLYNPLISEYVVGSPMFNPETSKAGSLSFSLYPNHRYYNAIKKMKSIIEVLENDSVIFRGRVFSDEANFYKVKKIEVEGALAYFNDSIVRPYDFTGSVLDYFTFLVTQHNEQVAESQRFIIGNVTVEDDNYYIVRANSSLPKTWEEIENKLLKLLGGYLVIRYEPSGNYLDYLAELTYTNSQKIVFGENLLDLSDKYDASTTYTAMIPRGAEIENEDGTKSIVTIEDLPDEDVTDDIVKSGDMIYSKSAVETYGGFIFAPISESTWTDVTQSSNLLTKAINKLTGTSRLLTNTFQINAVDLGYSDSQIASFRVSRNVEILSKPHNIDETIPLTKLSIPLDNPQGTKITVGRTVLSLTDSNIQNEIDTENRLTSAEKDIEQNRVNVNQTNETIITQISEVKNDCNGLIISTLKSYDETGEYGDHKSTMKSDISALSDKVTVGFESTDKQITEVNGEVLSVNTKLTKHFDFDLDGLLISGDRAKSLMSLLLDNDLIQFKKGDQELGSWDGVDFRSQNIIITLADDPTGNEKAQFGNFAWIPRSDGSLSLLKLGG